MTSNLSRLLRHAGSIFQNSNPTTLKLEGRRIDYPVNGFDVIALATEDLIISAPADQ